MTSEKAPAAELNALLGAYPLSSRWQLQEPFFERIELGAAAIHTVGLIARSEDIGEVTGSAGEIGSYPVARAVFELLERVSVLECRAEPLRTLSLRNERGEFLGRTHAADLFPSSPRDTEWRYALSSGVAVGFSFADACRRARAELVERDRLLRSWFGGVPPARLDLGTSSPPLPPESYRLEAYSLPAEAGEASLEVAAVFGFPRKENVPLVFGTAAAATLPAALDGAQRECLQRAGFLWGEELPDVLPSAEPSAAFHQEFYLCPASHGQLREWLDGGHVQAVRLPRRGRTSESRFANLTPEHLRSRLWVVKALANDELELAFGSYHPDVDPSLRSLGVHPIA